MIALSGTPERWDPLLAPALRIGLPLLGLLSGALLVWLDQWTLAPWPLAVGLVLAEVVLWARGDRPVRLELDDAVRLTDRVAGRSLRVAASAIRAVTVHARPRGDGVQAVVVLADDDGPRLALDLRVPPASLDRLPAWVDVDTLDARLGGYGGLLRAVAPAEIRGRQPIDDPAGQVLDWLVRTLDPDAWQRTIVRVWIGEAPPLDPFGLHATPPDGTLVLDGDGWALRRPGDPGGLQGLVTLTRAGHAARRIALARPLREGEAGRVDALPTEEVDLPLLVVALDEGAQLALPAPFAETLGPAMPLEATTWHTHVPEGGAVLSHLLRRWPEAAWPRALRRRFADDVDGPMHPTISPTG